MKFASSFEGKHDIFLANDQELFWGSRIMNEKNLMK